LREKKRRQEKEVVGGQTLLRTKVQGKKSQGTKELRKQTLGVIRKEGDVRMGFSEDRSNGLEQN